ncbi:hypothetical protein E4U32_002630 [Claviceps aff. humidiphila group G2b]|nr:hypothetical protein E4U32_002630 [Claviceps aff. humidiphila group G2b]
MTEDLQFKIMNAALAQVKRWGLPIPIEIPQYHWSIAGLTQRWCRLADLWVKVKPVPVWSIKGFSDTETHDPLNVGAEYFEPYEDEPRTEAGCSGPEGDGFEMDMGVCELYEFESETHKSEMDVEEDESEKIESEKVESEKVEPN